MSTEKNILLMGNPNVGKSVIFSRLTGAKVTVSNYPGTTVGFAQGRMPLNNGTSGILIDVPGIYNLDPASGADQVSVDMLERGDIIVNVVDATNLERNLYLTLELREKGIPMVVVLNMWDETRHKGVEIDVDLLRKELGVPVIPACGLTGEGIKNLAEHIAVIETRQFEPLSRDHKWEEVGRIVDSAQTLRHHHHTFLQRLEDITTAPGTGMPIALLVIIAAFTVIRIIGESIIGYVMEPLFDNLWLPVLNKFSVFLGGGGIIHDLLIGKLVDGQIDFGMSFGLLSTGLHVPLAAVLPYIISFYFVLGFMEDLGYLPRLATQVDNLMHRLGLHGYAIVPMILGLGCNVPGAMALRLLENRREKFIAGTLMAIAVPCIAQTAMIVGLVGKRGGQYVALIFGILLLVLIIKGLIMNRVMPGASPEILWEIPPYRLPQPKAVFKKLWMRISEFLKEAVPYVLFGVFIVNLMYMLRIIDFFSGVFSPILTGLWGLPRDTISAMLIGFLRKDVAIGMLAPLALTTRQLVIACTVLGIYFPCAATFIMMIRELGGRDMLKSAGLMLFTAGVVGAVLNLVLPSF